MEHIFNIIFILVTVSIAIAWLSMAPWVPTSSRDLQRVHKLAALKEGQKFYEIGCGNGRVCTYIARQNPTAQVIGIEYAFPFYLISKTRRLFFGPKNLTIQFGDAFKKNFSKADVVYVYALPDSLNNRLIKKMLKELKPGAKFISYVFTPKNWPGQVTSHRPNKNQPAIHVCIK